MSSQNDVTSSTETTTADRLIGRVKWFNSKAGYGFITVTDGDRSGNDIFVHHSSIGVSNQQYRYLVQGEYVQFVLSHIPNGTHEFQAASVCGINGGKLMCETRREFKIARQSYRETNDQQGNQQPANSSSVKYNVRRNSNRVDRSRNIDNSNENENKDWNVVQKRQKRPPVQNRDTQDLPPLPPSEPKSQQPIRPRRGRPPRSNQSS